MLRVGLTGELGSGKSTVAGLLSAHGAIVLSSDEMGRRMMQQGEPVYRAIVEQFGPAVVLPDGQLNRPKLAQLAFDSESPRVDELNAIIHPAVLAEQERLLEEIGHSQPHAIVVIESALIFTTKHAGGDAPWRKRFDQIVCVTAPDALKLQRYAGRVAAGRALPPDQMQVLQAEAQRRLAAQRISPEHLADCLVVENAGDLRELEAQISSLWVKLREVEEDRGQAKA